MENYDYVKVLLYGYSKLDMLADAVEDGARVQAALSFRTYHNTLELAQKISLDVLHGEKLRFWKRELSDLLAELSEEELFLLEYKYFRRKRQLATRFADWEMTYSERSYFRKQNVLLQRVACKLSARGLSEERFFDDFGEFSPFMRVYSALKEGWERKIVARRKVRKLSFSQNSAGSGGAGARLPRSTNTAIASTANTIAQITVICNAESDSAGGVSSCGGGVPSDGADVFVK